jgi:hypothetical protein
LGGVAIATREPARDDATRSRRADPIDNVVERARRVDVGPDGAVRPSR